MIPFLPLRGSDVTMYLGLSIWQGVGQFHPLRLVALSQFHVLQETAEQGYRLFLGWTVYQETHSSGQYGDKHKCRFNMHLFYTWMFEMHYCITSCQPFAFVIDKFKHTGHTVCVFMNSTLCK